MATNEELIQAARMLKENCDKTHCSECVFYVSPIRDCVLCAGECPIAWTIPKSRRWTDADIQLAKALKAFGVKTIYRKTGNWVSGKGDTIVSSCELPDDAFASLQEDETVSIDDILKESKE